MTLVKNFSDSLLYHMRVDLGGGNVRMTQHLLNRAQIGSPLQKVGRKSVPQCMGRDRRRNMSFQDILFQDFPETLPGHRHFSPGDEKPRKALIFDQFGAALLQINL